MKQRRQVTFVVRMWTEPHRDGDAWRGSIDSVGSKRRSYFSNLGALCEFMLNERERPAAPGEPDPDDSLP